MIETYGTSNGFGWKPDEVVGVRLITVPVSVEIEKAKGSLSTLLVAFLAVFGLLFITINILLRRSIIIPLKEISQTTTEISLGNPQTKILSTSGKDELAQLRQAINRLKCSLDKALDLAQKSTDA